MHTFVERRRLPRRKTLKTAYIAYRTLGTTIDCVVKNLSAGGARLDVESAHGIPDAFDLILKTESRQHVCKIVWRDEYRIGVQFL